MEPETPNQSDKEEQIARILKAVEERLRRELPDGPQTLDQIEEATEQLGEEIKREIQQEILDALGTGYSGRTLLCSCGQMCRYKSDNVRLVVTLHGEQPVARAYYYCSLCKRGFYPLDRILKLGRGQCSVRVRALACRFASYLPYGMAARELEMVCGVRLSNSSLQRLAKATGQALREEWRERQKRLREHPCDPKGHAPEQLHISMDGVMAHVGGTWREVKLGVCYERAEGKPSQRSVYYATLAPSGQFGQALRTLGWVAGEPKCRKVAVVADGSDWIWQEVGKHFTQRVQILDYFHATEHLYAFGRSRYGERSPKVEQWVRVQEGRLLDDRVDEVIVDMRAWQPTTKATQEVKRKELGYFMTHAHRMRYKTFKEAGYHIGSGVMESSCRWVVQQRMKGAGMRWSETGAEQMLHLRTAWCSRGHKDLFDAVTRSVLHA